MSEQAQEVQTEGRKQVCLKALVTRPMSFLLELAVLYVVGPVWMHVQADQAAFDGSRCESECDAHASDAALEKAGEEWVQEGNQTC